MSHRTRRLPIASQRFSVVFLLAALFFVPALAPPALAQSPGLDSAPLVEPYFNGVFPLGSPGTGASESWRVVNAYPHLTFNDPLVYTPLNGTNRIFVASRAGYIESFINSDTTRTKDFCLDIEPITAVVWDGGFLGMAFHPLFGEGSGKDYMFVYHSARLPDGSYPGGSTGGFFGTWLRLARYEVDPVTYVADAASEVQLFNIRLYNGSHRGGGLCFGGDGMLYLSIGDQFHYETAQDISSNFEGGIVRLDIDMDPLNSHAPLRFMGIDVGEADEHSGNAYWIPHDNPFLDPAGGIFEEFWTLGNRAPHRMTYDAMNDRFWSGEVGASDREELNIIAGGNNYGWPFREGLIDGPRSEPDSIGGVLTDPIMDWPRSESQAIIGGYVYRGTRFPKLYGKFICGDYSTKHIWAVSYDESTGEATREQLTDFDPGFLGTFGQDLDGEVYLCGLGPNRPIYMLEKILTNGPAPATLSATGFFTDMTTLEVTPLAIPYDINVTFWSDHAIKTRWAIFPYDGTPELPEERIAFYEQDPWIFPEGTVLVKHFEFGIDDTDPSITQRLETRFIVNGYRGEVYGLTYRWRPDGLDADLLTGGEDEVLTITTATGERNQTWHYPSRGECLNCHNDATGYALGVNARQWNREMTYPSTGRTDNQLVTMSALGLLDPPVDSGDLENIPALSDKSEETVPLEHRARSYLDANCSHCHQPGTGNRAGFDARFSTPLPAQNLVRGSLIDDLGINGAQVIAPQDRGRSMAHIRILTRDGSGVGMPAIATNVADSVGADLIARWIDILDADSSMNVAFGKAASQSSTAGGRTASRSVDGNTDGDLNNGSVSETEREPEAWWEVDLGEVFDLDQIVVFNRTDCCMTRLKDVHMFFSQTPFASTDLATTMADPTVDEIFRSNTMGGREEFDLDFTARYVRLQMEANQRLHMAEVQIFSHAWNQPPIQHPVVGNEFAIGGVTEPVNASNLVVNLSEAYENTTGSYHDLRIDEFSFHAASLGDPVTPFIALVQNGGALTVAAIGSTRLPQEMQLGPNTFAFDEIEAPVLEVAPGNRLAIGFLDAFPDGSGSGASAVVSFTEIGASNAIYWTGGLEGDESGSVELGRSPSSGAAVRVDLVRDYHFQMGFTVMEDINLVAVGVDPPALEHASQLRLATPVPNPFNPSTVLRMRLAEGARVDWAIYDVRGRRIVTLVQEHLPAGEHVRVWNGEDAQGARVASGVYFQKLSVPGAIRTNKMILVK